MLNKMLYENLAKELYRCHVQEDVEDILLALSEAIAEKEILDKEVTYKESYGRTVIEGRGICSEEEGELSVKLLTVKIGKKAFVIDDYFL